MDASLHFIKNGESIDKISLDKLIGNARIVNFTNLPENYCVTAKDLSQIPLCERTLFCFDWAKHWNTGQFYKQYPFFDETAAIYLISHGVKVLGMDTPSPDDSAAVLGGERDSVIHKLFLSNGVTLIEYLNNLDFALKDKTDWLLCALPLPFKGLDGSPSRVCLIDKGELYDN
jgi:arylformamidase